MPERLNTEISETLAEARALLEDLQAQGVAQVGTYDVPEDIPACPPEVRGVDRGGTTPCRQETLDEISADLGDCRRCPLCEKRKRIVFGVGNPNARLVFVGEGPGREEDEKGEPFVGEAGRLLDRILFAMGLQRSDVYICNVVKCRPPGNRDPLTEEIAACEPFLKRQLAAIRPRIIVALGRFAAQTLLRDDAPVSRLRGAWREYEGVPLMPTFHPAYLLRNPSGKREVWEDVKEVMRRLRHGESDG